MDLPHQIDGEGLLKAAKFAALEAGLFIKTEINRVSKNDIEEKELNSFVSYVDKEAEKLIVDQLKGLSLISDFITEENTVAELSTNSDYTWVIDPLDGTTNYLKRIPHFCVSIALEYKGVPVVGVVQDIMLSDTYSAIAGQGAYLNENKISVSSISKISEAIIATGFPYANVKYDGKLRALEYWLTQSQGIRRMGSAALDLVYVASGKLDAYYEAHLNRWDFSAGALIAKEAGAIVSDFSQNQAHLDKGEIIAASPAIYQTVINVIQRHFD